MLPADPSLTLCSPAAVGGMDPVGGKATESTLSGLNVVESDGLRNAEMPLDREERP